MCQQQPREFSLSCRQHLLAPRPQQRRPRRAQPPAPQWALPSSGTTHMGILRPAATRSFGRSHGPRSRPAGEDAAQKVAEPAQGAVWPLPGRKTALYSA